MALKTAGRAGISPFIAMEVLAAANKRQETHGDVVHLEVGEPAAGAPARVLEAARAALANERMGYTEALGLPRLRERIAEHYRLRYGVTVDPSSVVVTTGASGAFLLSFLAAFDHGDRVALAEPGYPAYRNILSALGLEVVALPVEADTRYQPTAAVLDRLGASIDGLILASPSNPTGTMLPPSALAELVAYCRDKGIRLISDEIYHGITYDEPAATVLAYDRDCVVVNSFSKYFAMTGWRLGWMILPPDLLAAVERLTQNFYISPPTLPQHAAIAAFDCYEELDAYVELYGRNRALLLEKLPKAGFDRLAPADGAFYVYADISRHSGDSRDFCKRMLNEIGVAATPGVDFDPARGHAFVRFSFAGSEADVATAADRLIAWKG
ncbi:MAG: 1-aminocyclopropane-1-carboxylate deaminase [Rhodospirillaceae bacterium]|nr:1-aminocyclopropane-1-carboxylate deaminase [Rhodospirillaceae bacterium]